jgi:hypothetical protein
MDMLFQRRLDAKLVAILEKDILDAGLDVPSKHQPLIERGCLFVFDLFCKIVIEVDCAAS